MITRLSERELITNMEVCAQRLTGREVIVRIKAHDGALGLAQRDLTGRAVIDLHPATLESVKLFAETFTHEAAHIREHFYQLPPRDVDNVRGELVKARIAQRVNTPAGQTYQRHESEADRTAARWMETVHDNYSGYLSSTNDAAMAILKILYHEVSKG